MIFKSLFGNAKKMIPEERLPSVQSFVEVSVMGRAMRSVSIEELNPKYIAVGETLGRVGERGIFVYQNANGRFRFVATITEVRDRITCFEIPAKVESLGSGGQKRSSVRLDTLVPGLWRMAPEGKGLGEFMKGSIRDISRTGCALITERQCKVGQWLEVKISLRSDVPAITVVGEIVRFEQIPVSGRISHGLRFHGLSPDEDRAITEFINRKQADLRSRGLA
jgi:c-di-GMP-binding flagellar brake protein YcgR